MRTRLCLLGNKGRIGRRLSKAVYRDIICEAQVQSQEQFMKVGVRVEDNENGASADPWGHRRQVSWVRRLRRC